MAAARDMDELTDFIAERSRSLGPSAAAEFCRELLADLPPYASRAELLVQLAEHCELAGDQASAERAYRDAVADGEAIEPDARAFLTCWCIVHGDRAEGERLAVELLKSRPKNPDDYQIVAEGYEQIGDLAAAAKWLTAGVLRLESELSDGRLYYLLISRRRVRQAQGLDEDEYDALAMELRGEVVSRFRAEANRS